MPDKRQAQTGERALLAPLLLGQFLVALDVSVVNVALPSIEDGLHLGPTGLQWVVNGYTVAYPGFLLLGGSLADADDPARLVLRGPRRARAMGGWMAIGAAGGATGGLVGGALTEWLSWRWVLLVNAPVGLAVLVAAARLLAADAGGAERRSAQKMAAAGRGGAAAGSRRQLSAARAGGGDGRPRTRRARRGRGAPPRARRRAAASGRSRRRRRRSPRSRGRPPRGRGRSSR